MLASFSYSDFADRTALAFDRAASSSTQTYDIDGRLHIAAAPISRACVCDYRAEEIPNWQSLGLSAGRTYALLRPADELAKSAPSFNGVPLLSTHLPVNAADHRPDLVVGSTGTDAEFNSPFLRVSLVVWAQAAIEGIVDGTCRALSAAYRYECVLEPGIFEGVRFSGRMVGLVANHVCLCSEGRVAGAVIGDSTRLNPATFATRYPDAARIRVL